MIRCEECLRANPPTRINCLYCSAPLPLTESSVPLRKPILRPVEKHEIGYNTILLPNIEAVPADAISEAASLVKLKEEDLRRILAERVPLPAARTASSEEADLIRARLQAIGFRVFTWLDQSSVKRVRSLGLEDAGLVINPGQSKGELEARWSDILLIVVGRLIEKRVEVKEIKTRRAENEILDTSEFFSDEPVIDFYLAAQSETWRIMASGFDFSCLGSEKGLIANQNIATLQRRLAATGVPLNDCYSRLRPVLDLVWSLEQETKSNGWRRERPGRLSFGVATIKSNESQFTRYSRLLYHLTLHQPE